MLRSIVAVLAGFLAVPVLALLADAALKALFPEAFLPSGAIPDGPAAFVLLYSELINVFGGWLTGLLAPRRPVLHAIILGVIGVGIVIPVAIRMWATTPAWFHISEMILTVPMTALGGMLAQRRRVAVRAA